MGLEARQVASLEIAFLIYNRATVRPLFVLPLFSAILLTHPPPPLRRPFTRNLIPECSSFRLRAALRLRYYPLFSPPRIGYRPRIIYVVL